MESYTVSARKYRPNDFESVVGQQHVTQTLKNAILSNHLAQAFLFCGPRGIGKTTCARILAKTINCTDRTDKGEACNSCESCKTIISKQSFNFYELDAASNNSVEDIRKLVDQVRFAPQSGKYKVYIIDEVHMLSQSAFNAFLKTLEEPPSYAIFILATTERQKIIPTILSRCQIFDFKRIQVKDIAQHLSYVCEKENVSAEDDALFMIAQKADGALRDSLSILDRIISFSGNHISYQDVVENLNILDYDYYLKTTDHLISQNYTEAVLLLDEIINKGFDLQNFLSGLSKHFRDLLFCKTPNTIHLLEIPETIQKLYQEQSSISSNSFLLTALNILNGFEARYKSSKNQRLHTELALLKLCFINNAITLAEQAEGTENNLPLDKKKTKPTQLNEQMADYKDSTNKSKQNTEQSTNQSNKNNSSFTSQTNSSSTPAKSNNSSSSGIMNLENIKKIVNTTSSSQKPDELNEDEKKIDSNLIVPDKQSLENAWNICKSKFEKQGGITLNTILKNARISIEQKGILEIEVDNKVLKETFEQEKSKLHEFMSSNLDNNNFELKCKYIASNNKKTRPTILSGKAIYEKMNEENPNLEDLRNRFELNVDN